MKLRIPKLKVEPKNNVSPRSIVLRMKKSYLKSKKKDTPKEIPALYYPYMFGNGSQPPMPQVPGKKLEPVETETDEGIEVSPSSSFGKIVRTMKKEREELSDTNITYPLNPLKPKKGEYIFSYANIKWEPKYNEPIHYVIEPRLDPKDKKLIEKIKFELEETLDIDFTTLGTVKATKFLRTEANKILERNNVPQDIRTNILYYIERDIIGFGKIDPLMRDPNIEDISCDGVGIPLFAFHRNPKFGSLKSNIHFKSQDELNDFVVRLAQKCGKTISIAEPLLDAALPDGSRVQATLGTDIARRGSNFTIRKFTDNPLTPVHMMKYGTMNSTQMAYLWFAVENGQSILISGSTATGKTSLLNTLSLFIKPSMKVVSIEDTAELRLPLPHWVPEVARSPLSIKGKKGEVTLFDLLKSSLRQRPDYIIVGEVRGREAFVLFQQMATGHSALSTIHAATIPQLVDRLTTPPIELSPNLLENIDIIIFLVMSKLRGKYVRRANNIMEVLGVENDSPVTKEVFKWKPVDDSFESPKKSTILKKLAERLGMTEETIKQELSNRKKILEWMLSEKIFSYKEVAKIINAYYTNPESLMDMVG